MADPKHIVVHAVTRRQKCQVILEGVEAEAYEKRQVFDLPEAVKLEVTEHQGEVKHCPQCGEVTRGEFPREVSQETQYGPRVRSQMVCFNNYQLVPLERTAEIIADLYQQEVPEGAVLAAVKEVPRRVTPVNEKIKAHLT